MRERIRGWEGPLFLLFAVPLSRERLLCTRRIAFRALHRGVGYLLEFRLLSYVNTLVRRRGEKASPENIATFRRCQLLVLPRVEGKPILKHGPLATRRHALRLQRHSPRLDRSNAPEWPGAVPRAVLKFFAGVSADVARMRRL